MRKLRLSIRLLLADVLITGVAISHQRLRFIQAHSRREKSAVNLMPTVIRYRCLSMQLGKARPHYGRASNLFAAPPRIVALSVSAIDSASTCRAHSSVPISKG